MKIVRRSLPDKNELPGELNPVVRRVLSARGICDNTQLDHSLSRLLPYQELTDIDAAVSLLVEAIRNDKHVLIVADFDADGATACAVGMRGLALLGAKRLSYVVPNRFEYGYGLTPEIVDVAAEREPDLIVTVDNGSSSVEGVARAKAKGIQVLITDHHLPGEQLPAADAMVNPNQPHDKFASKSLAGVGVMFYVLLATRASLREQSWFEQAGNAEPNLAQLLDLVALGTVADVVTLDYNNRILVSQGLARIRAGHCHAGLAALLRVCGCEPSRLASGDFAFSLAPRLNAAGRLTDMSLGIECLLSDDVEQCNGYANRLDALNAERREIGANMEEQANEIMENMQIDADNIPAGLCLFEESWHQGVVGILASRLKERLNRPAIAFARSGDQELKGSARSVSGVHIRDALDSVAASEPGLITKFGGHAMAAGLSLHADDFERFSSAFDRVLAQHPGIETGERVIYTDGPLNSSEVDIATAAALRTAIPWGAGIPEPLFDGEFKVLERRWLKQRHLKFRLSLAGGQRPIDAIAFGLDRDCDFALADNIHAVYRLAINDYAGRVTPQLILEHVSAV